MLTELIKQYLQESQVVVVPTGLLLYQVDENVFDKHKNQLASVMPSNWATVCEKLLEHDIDG